MKLTANKNNMVILEQGRLELFVYQKYMEGKMGVLSGSTIETLGLLPYRWYKKETDTTAAETGIMNMPSMILFHPTTVDFDKSVRIFKDSENKQYTIMSFDAQTDMWSKYGIKSLKNTQIFTESILNGKLDNNIPYPMIVPAWIKNMELNDMDLDVPATSLELIVHAMCRDKKTGKPFGEILGKDPTHSLIGYEFLDVRRASAVSVFGALSFEDQNAMLDMSINMTLQNKEQKESPLEKIIKY